MKKKRGPGQPTKYRKEYCALLVKHMADGFSFESFAGVVKVDRDTIYDWCDLFPEFLDAKRKGRSEGLLFDEKVLMGITVGKIKGNIAGQIFKMKCKYKEQGWTETAEVPEGTKVSIEYGVKNEKQS